MKKIIILICLFSIMLCSCSKIINKSNQETVSSEKEINQIIEEDSPIEFNNNFINKINFQFEQGYCPESVHWIDENNLLIVLQNIDSYSHKKIYTFSLNNISKRMIYEGEFSGNSANTKIFKLEKGNIVFRSSDALLIFNEDSMELLEEIHYDDNYEPEVSFDGKKFIYGTPDGVFISDITKSDSSLLLKTSESGFISPKMSLNNDILYACDSFSEDTIKINVYNIDNKKNSVYNTFNNSRDIDTDFGDGYWFPDNQHILLNLLHVNQDQNDILCIIDINTKLVKNFKIGKSFATQDLFNDYILYVNNCGIGNDSLSLLNYNTDKIEELTPKFLQTVSARFSPSGKQIVFIGTQKNNDMGMFLITK